MKKNGISYVAVNDSRLTVFTSSLEKQLFAQTHPDADIRGNHAYEPLYMLIDTEGTGFCLTPRRAVTYNESIDIIKHYL